MSLATPDKIRDLQHKLYRKAKNEPAFRFYQLYDKVYREDILQYAYALAKANGGAPGVDGESFADIESQGLEEWLNGLRKDLHDKTYQPQPVRRKMIPKPGGGERALGIPTVSANCTGAQIAFRMGGDPPSVPSAARPALPGFEGAPVNRY
jgi:RNA-directed DNA polymerase